MKTNNLVRSIFRVCLAAVLLPAAGAIAGTTGTMTCECGAPTEESYTWDFPAEATDRLRVIASRAEAAEDRVGRLAAYANRSPQMDWRIYAQGLVETKNDLNKISRDLCRLKLIDRVTTPWQQKTIDRIESLLEDAAVGTGDAIQILNENKETLMLTDFADRLEQVHYSADRIDDAIDQSLRRREAM